MFTKRIINYSRRIIDNSKSIIDNVSEAPNCGVTH
jgi:hypothetical protein